MTQRWRKQTEGEGGDGHSLLRFCSRISECLSVSEVLDEDDSPSSHTSTQSIHACTHTLAGSIIGKHVGIKEFTSYLIQYYFRTLSSNGISVL